MPQLRDLVGWQTQAMQSATDGIAIHDADGRFLWLNAAHARAYGLDPASLLGRHWSVLYEPAEAARILRDVLPALAVQGRWRGRAVGRRADGSAFPQDLSLTSLESGGLVCIVRDASERERAEEALRDAQRLESLALLAGGVAHDFNNLLAAILGSAAMARAETDVASPAHAQLERIELAARRAGDLTRQLLAYAGETPIEPVRVDVGLLVRETVGLLEAAVRKGTTVDVRADPDLPAVEADPTQLRQAVMNLVVNASEALGGRPGPVTVLVGARRVFGPAARTVTRVPDVAPGAYVAVEVVDGGAGIPAALRPRIFEPFFTTKRDGRGRGLGLAVVVGVARRHGGAVELESEEGRGSTFRLLLPVAAAPAAESAGLADRTS